MNIWQISFLFLLVNTLVACNSTGLVKGDVTEEDVKADNWNRKELVTTVQESLEELGYKPGNTNGKEDIQTSKAVKQYRIDHGLEISSSIDGDLERHIDDLIWTRRSEKSIDPREVAKVIVQNRDEEMCTRKIGKQFDQYQLPSISDHSSAVYIYRINNTEGAKPNYPASKIFINSKYVGLIDHNQHIRVEVSPGSISLTEESFSELDEKKQSKEHTFIAKPGKTYFYQLIVGKYDKVTHSSVSTSAPFYIGAGVLDYLIGELVWDIMNSHKYGDKQETFYYSDYITTKPHLGKCHIQLTRSSSDSEINVAATKHSNISSSGLKIYSNLPLYGKTDANNKLAEDTLNMITIFTSGQGCDAIDKVESSILQVPSSEKSKVTAKEKWIAFGCGTNYPYTVIFNEDGSGGKYFQVSKE